MAQLEVAFHNFANASKKPVPVSLCPSQNPHGLQQLQSIVIKVF
jgi:hypothetical protein